MLPRSTNQPTNKQQTNTLCELQVGGEWFLEDGFPESCSVWNLSQQKLHHYSKLVCRLFETDGRILWSLTDSLRQQHIEQKQILLSKNIALSM